MMDKLDQINKRLKNAKIGVAIERRGDRLSLRAILPPKSGESGTPKQQRISLGILESKEGLQFAENEAKIIGGLLAQGRFDWNSYLKIDNPLDRKISHWIEKFKDQYFSEREQNPTTLETWHHEYWKPLSRLAGDQPLTEKYLKDTLLQWTKPSTRSRRRYALAYAKIADCAGIDHGLRGLIGDYSLKAVSPRSLPSDEVIAQFYQSIADRSWQWIYGSMAAYGLRNHEAYFLDFEDYPVAYVNRGKTSERYIWPLYPEWADHWQLINILRPPCDQKTHSGYGNQISKGFKKLGIPFSPYNLRHSWARRSFEFGMDVTMASRMLGHSIKIHTEIYRHWIDKDSFNRAYQKLISHPDRPLPPC
jgi:integrase